MSSDRSALVQQREALRKWLDETDPAHAVFCYYFLYHPASRTRLFVERDDEGRIAGALAECMTGLDLFRPLMVMLAETDACVHRLLDRAGAESRKPCFLLGPMHYLAIWHDYCLLSQEDIYRVYTLDPTRYEPVVNVLVTRGKSPDGLPRYEIRSPQDDVLAVAGLNWQSPRYAEISVWVTPEARGRRWGESVLSALCGELLQAGITPIYLASELNEPSLRLAEKGGFRDAGKRLAFAEAEWLPR